MQKRNSTKRRPRDENQLAAEIVRLATGEGETEKSIVSQIMAEMGRKGGKIGGKRRLETMTAEQRSEVALKAARERWKKHKKVNSNPS